MISSSAQDLEWIKRHADLVGTFLPNGSIMALCLAGASQNGGEHQHPDGEILSVEWL